MLSWVFLTKFLSFVGLVFNHFLSAVNLDVSPCLQGGKLVEIFRCRADFLAGLAGIELLNPGTAILKKQAPRKISACSLFGRSFTSFTVCCQRQIPSLLTESVSVATVSLLWNCFLLLITASPSGVGFSPSFSASIPVLSFALVPTFCLLISCARSSNFGATHWKMLLGLNGFNMVVSSRPSEDFASFCFSSQAWNLLWALPDSSSSSPARMLTTTTLWLGLSVWGWPARIVWLTINAVGIVFSYDSFLLS